MSKNLSVKPGSSISWTCRPPISTSGGAGANGPVVVVVPGLPTGTSGALSESFTLRGTDLIARSAHGFRNFHELAYACAAGNCYLNFHTTGNPGGEIRIQLCPASAEANTFTGLAVCTTP